MKKLKQTLFLAATLLLFVLSTASAQRVIDNPKPICHMLQRMRGKGIDKRILTILDESLAQNGQEVFLITARHGKPCIQGSTLSAITTGIGWYLNHHAHINLSWN